MQDNTKKAEQALPERLKLSAPEIKDMLTSGVQFGHQTQKWNPKMREYIFTNKNKIHIIDLTKTREKLKEAMDFIYEISKKGNILFVGTKRQVSEIIKKSAVESGSYYITHRWPGGLLTNHKLIQKSIKRLNQLEEEFEKGVANRTKFEVSQQKKEWEKMNRIYEGIKTMDRFPVTMVIVDTKYERLALREATSMNIPIIAMVDTNCDPTLVAYPIPANDDAIRSVTLIMDSLGRAIKEGNGGKGVRHVFKDYSTYEVQTIKKIEDTEPEVVELAISREERPVVLEIPQIKGKNSLKQKGIFETIQENKNKEEKKITVVKKDIQKKEVKKITKKEKVVKKVKSTKK